MQGDAASRDGGGQHHVLPGVQANERHRPLSASPPSCRLTLCLRVLLLCAVMTAVGVLFITGGIVVSPQRWPSKYARRLRLRLFGAAQVMNKYRELLDGGPRVPVSPNPRQRQNL